MVNLDRTVFFVSKVAKHVHIKLLDVKHTGIHNLPLTDFTTFSPALL